MTPDQRAKRLHYHLYESLEGITEHAERIVKLEELVADMLGYYAMPNDIDYKREAALLERARELGIEP